MISFQRTVLPQSSGSSKQPASAIFTTPPSPTNPGHAVAQLVEALCYKPDSREFDSR
jgi:hypothetical protein